MRSSSFPRVFFVGFCAVSTLLALGGCNSTSQTVDAGPMGVPSQPSSIPAERLVGKWGVAAYHRDSDRPRTEGEARRQCSNSYNITRGSNGGVMMHLADQAQPQELVLKGSAGGTTYLGPAGRAGIDVDREIVAISDNSFTVKWVSPDNSSRYGTMVYIRCS
jgi:hypothetical protein